MLNTIWQESKERKNAEKSEERKEEDQNIEVNGAIDPKDSGLSMNQDPFSNFRASAMLHSSIADTLKKKWKLHPLIHN